MNKKTFRNTAITTMAATATVAAVAPAAAADVQFEDVSQESEHYDAIMNLVEQGAISGYEDGTFRPYEDIDRGQVAKILTNSLGLETPGNMEDVLSAYTDVDSDHEYAEAIAAVTEAGVFGGSDDNEFNPWESISREQMASVLVEAYDLNDYEGEEVELNTEEISEEHVDAVQKVVNLGISENPDDFDAWDPIQRDQFSSFVDRTQEFIAEQAQPTVESLSAINSTIIEVTFENGDVVEVELDEELTDGENEVTFEVDGAQYTETVTYEAPLTSGFAGFVNGVDGTLEDATVTVNGKTATTNENGFYHLTDVDPGTHTVSIEADGYETETIEEDVVENEVSTLSHTFNEVIDTNAIEVTGVVVDSETGANIEDGTSVTLESYNDEDGAWETIGTTTTTNGEYTLNQETVDPDFELGGEYRQTVSVDNYKDFSQTVTLDDEDVVNTLAGIELEEIDAIDINGTVTDSEGNAVEGADVTIEDEDGNTITDEDGNNVDAIQTNADGQYTVNGAQLLSGTYNVVVDDGNSAISNTEMEVEEGMDVTHDVQLEDGYTLNTSIGTESVNDDFTNAEYTVELMDGNTRIGDPVTFNPETENVSTLDFEMDRIASGDYTLKLSGDYVETEEYDITVDEATTIEKRANPAGVLAGTISTSNDDSAITGTTTTVNLLNDDGEVVDTVETEDGEYKFTGVAEGDYMVQASAANHQDGTQEESVSVDQNSTSAGNDLTLDPVVVTGTASGYVREAGSLTALKGATVTYYNTDGEQVDSVQVNNDGSYTTSNLDKGNYQVIVRGEGVETLATSQMIEADEDLSSVNYELEDGGDASLDITAVNSDGDQVEIASKGVTITDWFHADEKSEGMMMSGNEGATETVTLENLSGGTYNLDVDFASDEYVDVDDATATLATSEEGELEFTVEEVADQRSVDFRVVDENNTDLNSTDLDTEAEVVVYNEDGEAVNNKVIDPSDDNWVNSFSLVDGNYTLAVYKNGYVVEETDFTVDGEDITIPVMQLTPIK